MPRSVDSGIKLPWLTVAVPRRGARPCVEGSYALGACKPNVGNVGLMLEATGGLHRHCA